MHLLTALGPAARALNYRHFYNNAVRTESGFENTVAGPLDIRERGREHLLAEYLATPGKRYDDFEYNMTRRQMYAKKRFLRTAAEKTTSAWPLRSLS